MVGGEAKVERNINGGGGWRGGGVEDRWIQEENPGEALTRGVPASKTVLPPPGHKTDLIKTQGLDQLSTAWLHCLRTLLRPTRTG